MKIKYLLAVAAIVAATQHTFAQYSQDALRFSTFTTGSTARIKAVGNAGTAVGGDLSSVAGNPAGIGFFTRSEFSFTPEFDGSKVNSTYLNSAANASKSTLNFNNTSVVIYNRLNTPKGADKTKGWLSLNVGLSYNRTNNYYEDINYGGKNNTNSIASYYAEDANGQGTPTSTSTLGNNTLGQWGYNEYLIDKFPVGSGVQYQSTVAHGESQLSNSIRTGGQSEFDLSIGANYSNSVYLGASLGISNLRYNTTSTFTESGTTNVFLNPGYGDRAFTSVYSQDQITKGTGVNAKFGAIFKPVDAVRIGVLFTTPTYYNIDDSYTEGLSSKINTFQNFKDGPVNYPFSYTLTTPLKVAGGISVFAGKLGFITGDVEYQDFSTMTIKGDYSGQSTDNSNIKSLYQAAVTARIGAEARVGGGIFLRGGYGVQGNPQKYNGSDIKTTSGGLGYRSGVYYIDATFSHIEGSQTVYPYELASAGSVSPGAYLSKTNNNVFVTFGLRF